MYLINYHIIIQNLVLPWQIAGQGKREGEQGTAAGNHYSRSYNNMWLPVRCLRIFLAGNFLLFCIVWFGAPVLT